MMYFQNFVGDISVVIAKYFSGMKGTVEEAFKNADGFVKICMAELGSEAQVTPGLEGMDVRYL